jgi:hypothetical protein
MSKKSKLKGALVFGDNIHEASKEFMEENGVSSMLLIALDGKGRSTSVVECHGNDDDYELIKKSARLALSALKEEVEKARKKAEEEDTDDEDEDEEISKDELKAMKLKRKLMKALGKKGFLKEDGRPTSKALRLALMEIATSDEKPSAAGVLNKMAGYPLTDKEVELVKKYTDDNDEDEDEDDDED